MLLLVRRMHGISCLNTAVRGVVSSGRLVWRRVASQGRLPHHNTRVHLDNANDNPLSAGAKRYRRMINPWEEENNSSVAF